MRLGATLVNSASGALLGAAIWIGVGYMSGYEIGLVAVVVGLMAGAGACKGSRGEGGQSAGVLAAILAIGAIAIARLVTFFMFSNDPNIEYEGSLLSPLDFLFIVIAAMTAYKAGSGRAFAGQSPNDRSAPDA
jgi:hypothetical protein